MRQRPLFRKLVAMIAGLPLALTLILQLTAPDANAAMLTRGPAPVIYAITPNTGSTSGGTMVTITGNLLTGTLSGGPLSSVMFGSVDATSFTVVSSTEVTATSPAQSAGTVCVMLHYQGGGGASSRAGVCEFTYLAAPAIPGVSRVLG